MCVVTACTFLTRCQSSFITRIIRCIVVIYRHGVGFFMGLFRCVQSEKQQKLKPSKPIPVDFSPGSSSPSSTSCFDAFAFVYSIWFHFVHFFLFLFQIFFLVFCFLVFYIVIKHFKCSSCVYTCTTGLIIRFWGVFLILSCCVSCYHFDRFWLVGEGQSQEWTIENGSFIFSTLLSAFMISTNF